MSRTKGEKIALQFSEKITNAFDGVTEKNAFTVTGQEPLYIKYPEQVLGPLVDKVYAVTSVKDAFIDSVSLTQKYYYSSDFNTGSFTNVSLVDGEIVLSIITGV